MTFPAADGSATKLVTPTGLTIHVGSIAVERRRKIYDVTGGADTEYQFQIGTVNLIKGKLNGLVDDSTGSSPGWTITGGTLTMTVTGEGSITGTVLLEVLSVNLNYKDIGGPIPIVCAFIYDGGTGPTVV
jgi:hypothetical protein|tara:strand:- start:1006 stop:1395 length:390 start_codon:yes stop_codon:yes gene_type:complete